MFNKKEREGNYKEDIRLIYEIYTEDIRHVKNQQWLTIYYALLLQAGIIAFTTHLNKPLFPYTILILASVSICIGLITTIVLIYYQIRLIKYRNRIDRYLKPNLHYLALQSLDKPLVSESDEIENYSFYDLFDLFLRVFILFSWGGVFFVLWFLFQLN